MGHGGPTKARPATNNGPGRGANYPPLDSSERGVLAGKAIRMLHVPRIPRCVAPRPPPREGAVHAVCERG